MSIFSKINQRILMMARRRETNDGEPGLPGSVQCDVFGNLYVNLVPTLPPGGDPGNYVAVDLNDTEYGLAAPTYAFPVASFLYGQVDTATPQTEQIRLLSQANAGAVQQQGVLQTAKPGQWNATIAAAENVAASATRAAGGAGTRLIAQGFEFTLSGLGNSPQDLICRIRDGAGGAILWQSYIFKDIGGASVTIAINDISLPASVNTALVAEFSAAGGANTFQSINVRGVTVT